MTKVVADITMSLDGFVTGPDPDLVTGGGDVIRQCVDTGPADELIIHLAPIVLGSGTPLLVDCHRRQLVQREVRSSPSATHLTYALRP
jgi:dihydrofolate reductase